MTVSHRPRGYPAHHRPPRPVAPWGGTVERIRELDILDRVMAHRAAGNTTDMAPEMYANPVATYVEGDRYEREVERLFRGCPIVACLSCDVADPGDHVTLSITDVPI